MNNYIFLSFALFLASIYLFIKTEASKIKKAIFVFLFLTSIIFYLFYFIADYFTGQGVDMSVLYYLDYGLTGAGFLEYWEVIFLSIFILLACFVFSLWMVFGKINLKYNKNKKSIYFYIALLLMIFSLVFNPSSLNLYKLSSVEHGTTSFYKYYKHPSAIQINNSKNLVFIYIEGLEQTYFNESIFPGLTKNLNKIQSESIYFTGIELVTGTGWTIGGIVSSQCGIPLFTPSHGNSMSGMDEFLGLAICFGDLLHKEDYYLTYYGGADLEFGGKGKFFSTHGFDEVHGKEELLPKLTDDSYKSWWGLYDDSLFDLSYDKFMELSKNQEKFTLFLLTLDTHHPKGHPSKSCENITYKEGGNPMLNAVACSDYLVSKFIDKIKSSLYGNDTVIVVVSDHLALENTASDILNKQERRNLFMIITPENNESVEINNLGSTLDISPTLLPFIGYQGEIGLGRNLLSEDYSEVEINEIHKNLTNWKPIIFKFWDFPRIEEFIEIDVENKTIEIDYRKFKIPIFIEFNDQLETSLDFYDYLGQGNLINNSLKLKDDEYFLLVDECKKIERKNKGFGGSSFCLVIGNKEESYESAIFGKRIRLTRKEIEEIKGGLYEK